MSLLKGTVRINLKERKYKIMLSVLSMIKPNKVIRRTANQFMGPQNWFNCGGHFADSVKLKDIDYKSCGLYIDEG